MDYQNSLFQGLGTPEDNWSTVNSQYPDGTGQSPSFNGSVLAGTWVDDSVSAPASASAA